jgi:hypothetical protein
MDDQLDAVVVGSAGVGTNVYLVGDDIDWSVETNFMRNVDCVGQAGGYSSQLFPRLASAPATSARSARTMPCSAASCSRATPAR